jgi:fructose-1,6-bisphosphatase-3
MDVYGDDPCEQFMPQGVEDMVNTEDLDENEQRLMARMQKAISVIQFKLEGQIIQRRPHYNMDDRLLLDKIDVEQRSIHIDGRDYPLLDGYFPTLRGDDPYRLTEREQGVVDRLRLSFQSSERLQRHVRFLYAKGNMYLVQNNLLLYHGCISMNPDGSFVELEFDGEIYSGKKYMDRVERLARQGYFARDPALMQYGQDAMWYLWSGSRSPLFGKDKMATFERYFVDAPALHKERMNPYYDFRDDPQTAARILEEFGLDPQTGRIINGHVPVRVSKGESPIKADGRLLVIDGGFAKAYQSKTGIAGYTLIYNSYGLLLASHDPFESTRKAIREDLDMVPHTEILQTNTRRIRVRDTDGGRAMLRKIDDLKLLLEAYRSGLIKESA